MNKSKILSKQLEALQFSKMLKLARSKTILSQTECAEMLGMSWTRYRDYESGKRSPNSLALASGMLIDLGLDKDHVDRLLERDGAKPLPQSGFAMTKREEALIQWFDQQLEACMLSFKPLGRFAALAMFLANHLSFSHWLPFKHLGQLVAWLDKKGTKYTKQSAHQQYEKIRQSFAKVCVDVDKVENPDTEEPELYPQDHHSIPHFMDNNYY